MQIPRFLLIICLLSPLFSSLAFAEEVGFGLPENCYRKFSGRIGDLPVTMDLVKTGNRLSGTYSFDKNRIPIEFSGSIGSTMKVELTEKNGSDEVTGRFSGHFIDDVGIRGQWRSANLQRKLEFELVQKTEGAIAGEFRIMNFRKCQKLEETESEDNEVDSSCYAFSMNAFEITSPLSNSTAEINRKIIKLSCGEEYSSYDEFFIRQIELQDSAGEDLELIPGESWTEHSAEIILNENYVFCIRLYFSEMISGAAHPLSGNLYKCYSLTSGKELLLKDLFPGDLLRQLTQIGKTAFYKQNGSEGWSFENGVFYLPENFFLSPTGIGFQYSEYEIGPYVAGQPQIFISYKQIASLIRPSSLLAPFLQK